MKKLFVFMVMAFAVVGFSGFALASNGNNNGNALEMNHKKITGDVNWTSAGGVENLKTVFSVHLNAPGKNSIRGTVTLYNPDGSMRFKRYIVKYIF